MLAVCVSYRHSQCELSEPPIRSGPTLLNISSLRGSRHISTNAQGPLGALTGSGPLLLWNPDSTHSAFLCHSGLCFLNTPSHLATPILVMAFSVPSAGNASPHIHVFTSLSPFRNLFRCCTSGGCLLSLLPQFLTLIYVAYFSYALHCLSPLIVPKLRRGNDLPLVFTLVPLAKNSAWKVPKLFVEWMPVYDVIKGREMKL